MLNTLRKIGEQLLEGQGIWARLTTEPKFNEEKSNWVCPILFDCVNKEIRILKDEMELFKPDKSKNELRCLNPEKWGRNGKKCALTIETKKLYMLDETLFGNKDGDAGSMMQSMKSFNNKFIDTELYKALEEIGSELRPCRDKLDLKKIKKEIGFGRQDEAVMFYSKIKSESINGGESIKLVALDGYESFVIGKFGTPKNSSKGINYITGNLSDEIVEAEFTGRRNINKIFQMTASNYASGFSDFKKNFQSDPNTFAALDKASEYLLENETRIAGIPHIVVPSFLNKDLDDFDIEETEFFLDKSSDLLFRLNELSTSMERDLPETDLFWVNYVAFESVGNEFKILNHIKDVNSRYIQKLIEIFGKTGIAFRDYIGGKYTFNLQSIYYIIPIRDSKKRSKVNPVLNLFKNILEQRRPSSSQLFSHFIKLIICNRNGQFDDKGKHKAFPNIAKPKHIQDSRIELFDYTTTKAVFKYLALFHALKQLNLLDMETIESNQTIQEIQQCYPNSEVDEFLNLKTCSRNQIALFCLGRALNVAGYAQERKGHSSKPILNKINFNGMNYNELINLYKALMEKGKQYQKVKTAKGNIFWVRKKIEEWLDLFGKYSDPDNWTMNKEEAVFYLLAGYVFRPSTQLSEDITIDELRDETNNS